MTRRTVITLACLLFFLWTAVGDPLLTQTIANTGAPASSNTPLQSSNCKFEGNATLNSSFHVIWFVPPNAGPMHISIHDIFSNFSCRFKKGDVTTDVENMVDSTMTQVCKYFNETTYKFSNTIDVVPIVLVTQGKDLDFPPCIDFSPNSTFVQVTFSPTHLALRGYAHTSRTDYLFSCGNLTALRSSCDKESIRSVGDIIQLTISPSRLPFVFEEIIDKKFDTPTMGMAVGISIGVAAIIAIIIGVTIVVIVYKRMKTKSTREHMKLAGAIMAPKAKTT